MGSIAVQVAADGTESISTKMLPPTHAVEGKSEYPQCFSVRYP
jgi:hypothetical protein